VRPWAPTPQPSPSAIAAPSPQATPAVAAAAATTATTVSAPFTVPVAVAGFAAPHLCRPPTDNERLVFVRPVTSGADCVRTVERDDGIHLIVETNPGVIADYGVIAKPRGATITRVFVPSDWPNPVVVVSGSRLGAMSMLVVVTWQARSSTRLFVGMGERMDIATDAKGWPRVSITTMDPAPHIRTYGWDGNAFGEQ
jgi:hypothetical protein